ncbi:NUDIX hydrolase [Candidatus Pacearchaeota archaeon CG10_big_fil_rev_8_21_14_0_10_34_76]|nr:MAG: NUDIX hydrolase [Candidatus Pacearchaeota archaeon CG10_big_fil_rev_8_21_14_0_10_34_76]
MPRISTGLVMYKLKDNNLFVFIVHPGGPFWKNKDEGAWSIPKGEVDDNKFDIQSLLKNARREFKEETGISPPENSEDYIYLDSIKQKNNKIVHAWAFPGNWSGLLMCSSFVNIEYPYLSGKFIKIPEVDKADFFPADIAKKKINPAQVELIERLEEKLMNKK